MYNIPLYFAGLYYMQIAFANLKTSQKVTKSVTILVFPTWSHWRSTLSGWLTARLQIYSRKHYFYFTIFVGHWEGGPSGKWFIVTWHGLHNLIEPKHPQAVSSLNNIWTMGYWPSMNEWGRIIFVYQDTDKIFPSPGVPLSPLMIRLCRPQGAQFLTVYYMQTCARPVPVSFFPCTARSAH